MGIDKQSVQSVSYCFCLSHGVVFILKALIPNVILFIVNNNVIIRLTLIVKCSIT